MSRKDDDTVKKTIFIAFVALTAILSLMLSAGAALADYKYRFDDVYGPSGIGGQWIVVTRSDDTYTYNTRGGIIADAIQTEANIVNSRDHVYSINGKATDMPTPVPHEAIRHIFMVIPDNRASIFTDFTWMNPTLNPGETFTGDVRIGEDYYYAVKQGLGNADPLTNSFRFDLTKSTNAAEYGTVRSYMSFHQNPTVTPSQTLNIPLVIANVANGIATANPLEFRTVLRGTTLAGTRGDIVAYDHFKWDVTRDWEFGGDNDWIFVPLPDNQIDAHTVNYTLTTDIRNFCGIRYELQRYDDRGFSTSRIYPNKWIMDLPSGVGDVNAELVLDELSHIAPGMITTYRQPYNVVTAAKKIFRLYGVDTSWSSTTPRDLLLKHTTIYGVDLGEAAGSGYTVRGFQYLPSNKDFLVDAACDLVAPSIEMPALADAVMTGAVSDGFVTADAVSTVKIESAIPSHMQYTSNDIVGLLPLHVTFNLPKTNRFVVGKWESLLDQWKKTGDIMDTFSESFRLHMHANDATDIDLTGWMKEQDVYAKNVKVFMDEEKECVTVSFIAMLVDSKKTTVSLLSDKTTNTDRKYVAIRDGNRNDKWDMTFYISHIETPKADPNQNTTTSGGGGGGCNAGWPLAGGMLAAVFAVMRKRKEGEER